jgi:hypothetical protein
MFRALVYKELRETGWIALIALAAYLVFVINCAGYLPVPFFYRGGGYTTPFLDGEFSNYFCVVSVLFAIALGLAQTVLESRRGTWLFLLHRPMRRRHIFAVKLAVGCGLYLGGGALGIVALGLWAAIPGNHASPFEWWMTADTWKAWAAIGLLYVGAFLTGMRSARWFGTRLFPLFAAGIAALFLVVFPPWPILRVAAGVLVAACLAVLIDYTAHERDFS